MKKLMLLLSCAILSSACAQNKNAALLKLIDKDVEGIDRVLEFSDMRIEAGPVKTEPFDANADNAFEQDAGKKDISATSLQKVFDNAEVTSALKNPYNIVTVKPDESLLKRLMGVDNFYFMENDADPVYTPVQLEFKDGTRADNPQFYSLAKIKAENKGADGEIDTVKLNPVQRLIVRKNDSFFKSYIAFNGIKPIQRITMDIALQVPRIQETEMSAPGEVTVNGVTLRLVSMAGSTAVMQYPAALGDRLQVEGYYKDGRRLRQTGSSNFTVMTPERKKAMLQLKDVLKQAAELVKKGSINTEDQVGEYVENHTPAQLNDNVGIQEGKFKFAGPVSKLLIKIKDTTPDMRKFRSTYTLRYEDSEKDYMIAGDFNTGKAGIINNSGVWLVPPFALYLRQPNKYFFWDQMDDYDKLYWFNPATKKLTEVPYKIMEAELIRGRYMLVEKTLNTNRGVIDAITGKIVVPMQYDNVLPADDGKNWVLIKHGQPDRTIKGL